MIREQFPETTDQIIELYAPIPEVAEVAGWKEVPIHQTERFREKLVPLGIFTENRQILTSSVYDDEHDNSPYDGGLDGGLTTLFAREGVVERLHDARSLLPRGYHLMAMDTYRPLVVQGALYRQYEDQLRDMHPDWSQDELAQETQKYVSVPSEDATRPSPHNTGGAVDVVVIKLDDDAQTQLEEIDDKLSNLAPENWQDEYLLEMERSALVRAMGKMLNFGTKFDKAGMEGWLEYYEWADFGRPLKPAELEALKDGTLSRDDAHFLQNGFGRELTQEELEAQYSRRVLYHIMTKAGFEPYADEWWHYNDPASQMGAKTAGREFAEYGAASLSQENLEHEEMRKLHRINTERLASGVRWTPPVGFEKHYQVALTAANGNNPSELHPDSGLEAEKISPNK